MVRESKDKLNEYFQKIASLTNKSINEDWKHAVLGVFVYQEDNEDFMDVQCFYQKKESGDYIDLQEVLWDSDDEMEGAFEEMILQLKEFHKYCQYHHDNWKIMTFNLLSNGRFFVDFDYDIDCQNHLCLEEWKARYFVYE